MKTLMMLLGFVLLGVKIGDEREDLHKISVRVAKLGILIRRL